MFFNTMLIDSHCHLNHSPLVDNLTQILQQAGEKGINHFLVPATCPDDWSITLQLAQSYPQIYAAIGIHPWFVASYNELALSQLEQLLHYHSQALIGEIGLDFARAPSLIDKNLQINCFEAQLQLAKSAQRPAIIHHVHTTDACLHSIKRCRFTYGGIAHAFSGSMEEAQAWIKHGFLIGVGSLLLRPQAKKIRLIAEKLPLQHMVIETDAPYMSPLPHQNNSPDNIRQIAEIIASLRNCHWQDIATITSENALKIIPAQS
ncbi:TatD family hydrolase [Snodgrassella alvi]|nr:TatD family hydrolase [Snodgrassella alvi]